MQVPSWARSKLHRAASPSSFRPISSTAFSAIFDKRGLVIPLLNHVQVLAVSRRAVPRPIGLDLNIFRRQFERASYLNAAVDDTNENLVQTLLSSTMPTRICEYRGRELFSSTARTEARIPSRATCCLCDAGLMSAMPYLFRPSPFF